MDAVSAALPRQRTSRWRMYSTLVLAFAVLLCSFFGLTYYFYRNEISEDLERNGVVVHNALRQALGHESQTLLALLSVLNDQESLIRAMQERDRRTLLDLGAPILEELRERESITHFYFHAPDGTNFLRIHEPAHFGDRITRHTMQEAQRTGKPSVGNEQGPFGTLTLRAVTPWTAGGELIGYLELGIEFEAVVEELDSTLEANTVVIVDKSLLNHDDWQSTNAQKRNLAEGVHSVSGWDDYPDVVVVYNSAGALPAELSERLSRRDGLAPADTILHLSDGRYLMMVRTPLVDVHGREVAHLLLLHDMTGEVLHARNLLLLVGGLSAVVCGLLLLGFCIIFERIQRAMERQADELNDAYQQLQAAVTEREKLHKRLLVMSRQEGMAEVATGVLHNVGNVLNSVNVSANVLAEKLRNSELASFVEAGRLIRAHREDLASYITDDERGRHLPEFLVELADCLIDEHEQMRRELESLGQGVSHIRHIITTQQTLARRRSAVESIRPAELMESALRMQMDGALRSHVTIDRRYEQLPPRLLDKHRVLQILMNLISNAKHALRDSDRAVKRLTLIVAAQAVGEKDGVRFEVRDNGIGITAENLSRVFTLGFTTRDSGHGYGLHTAATSAQETGGSLNVASDGPGSGATFTLIMPVGSPASAAHDHRAEADDVGQRAA